MSSILGYWIPRGICEPIRYLLEYAGEKYENQLYECGDGPEFSIECWLKVKFTLGLDFPNLPYYFDGKVKLSQTNAILKYLARKHNMDAKTEQERIHMDMLIEEITDLRNAFVTLCYRDNAKFDVNKPAYIKNFRNKLALYEKYLGNNQFFIGNNVTYIDFCLFEIFDQNREFEPSSLDDFPKLQSFVERVKALPAIKAYMESGRFRRQPINNKMAAFI